MVAAPENKSLDSGELNRAICQTFGELIKSKNLKVSINIIFVTLVSI